MKRAGARLVHHGEEVAAHPVHERLHDSQHGIGGNRGVHGVPAGREHLRARLGRQRRAGRDDAARGGDKRSTRDNRHREGILIICMVMIANLQYGWTLFVGPIDQKYQWGRAAIQFAFTIFVLTETWLVPIEGYLIDKFGPRIMISASGVLVAIAWVINSIADSLFLLYLGAAIGGIGAGVIYGGSVGNALKWFPDRRGLAAGLTAAGFGAGSALTVIPIANMIQSSGYESAFLWFGLGQGIIVVARRADAARAGGLARSQRRRRRLFSRRGATTRRPRRSRRRSSGSCMRCSSWSAPAASWRSRSWDRSPRTSTSRSHPGLAPGTDACRRSHSP